MMATTSRRDHESAETQTQRKVRVSFIYERDRDRYNTLLFHYPLMFFRCKYICIFLLHTIEIEIEIEIEILVEVKVI